jgi:predicted DNA-binding WGR domain protein
MKIFFYMKRNPENISGTSFKTWKIERKGRKVTRWWGPAESTGHMVYPACTLQTCVARFRSEREAIDDEKRLVRSKLAKGYERVPRMRPWARR